MYTHSQIQECETNHIQHHEPYDDIIGDGYYGPYWERGIKCKERVEKSIWLFFLTKSKMTVEFN